MQTFSELKGLFGGKQSEQKLEETEEFEQNKLINPACGRMKQLSSDDGCNTIIFAHDSDKSEIWKKNCQLGSMLIYTKQNPSNLVMYTHFKLLDKSNRIKANIKQSNNYILNNGDHNTLFYFENNNLYIQFKQVRWGVSQNFICSQDFENEINNFIDNIDPQKIKNSVFQGEEKQNKNQDWVKNQLQKMELWSTMMLKNFTALDRKQKLCQPFQFMNVLKEEKDKQILFQCYNENNLYKRQYIKKVAFESTQELVHSLNQLSQQINGFLSQLSAKQQKILKNAFIRLGFDIKKRLCFQFDQVTEDLNKMILGEDFRNLSFKKQKKLIESLCIIYYLQEHSVLNENYFNENVFQVDSKGKLKINFLQSNELNKCKNNQQNQNFQSGTQNKLHHLIELIGFVVQINQNKQQSETDSDNLVKLNQIVQYNSLEEQLQISQVLYVLDQVQFCQKEKITNNE